MTMRYIIFFLTTALFLTGCNKDKYLRLPAVATSSVEVSGTDVIVTGKVTDDGNAGIWTLGFCYDQGQAPETILKNQTLVDWMYEDGTFKATIPGLKQNLTYYFKAFIVNDIGYSMGDVVKYTVPRFEAPKAPCENSLTTNRITDSGQPYTVTVSSDKYIYTATYDISVDCGYRNPDITFSFREKPITGIYGTVQQIEHYGTINDNDVLVKISKTTGFSTSTMIVNTGQLVYVNCMDENKIVISFCDLTYRMYVNYTYYDVTLSGKFELKVW